MKKHLYILLMLTFCLVGCSKKESGIAPATSAVNATEPTTGGLKGMISPAGSVVDITAAMLVDGKMVTTTIKPGADGSFAFKDLTKGSGNLYFNPAVGYDFSTISVVVTAGKDTDLGLVQTPLTPGSLSGTVSPAAAVNQITIRSTSSPVYTAVFAPDAKTGSFKWVNLPVGTYTLSFSANFGYIVPASRTITITTAQNTDAGTIQINPSVRGSISGMISPAGSAATVMATSFIYPVTTFNVVPDASGAFTIPNIVAGNYLLSVKPANNSNLYAPLSKSVVVNEGIDSKVGTILLSATLPPYSFSMVINGSIFNTRSALATYTVDQQRMSISGGSILINIEGITAQGEYVCNSATGSYIYFYGESSRSNSGYDDGVLTATSSTTKSGNGNAVIKITSIDEVNKTISGTFSGTLNGSAGQKVITNGVLTDVPYQ